MRVRPGTCIENMEAIEDWLLFLTCSCDVGWKVPRRPSLYPEGASTVLRSPRAGLQNEKYFGVINAGLGQLGTVYLASKAFGIPRTWLAELSTRREERRVRIITSHSFL
jgi:hypothetical protein